ncbi:Septin-domain-containing protein [Powellomyces hirtus]|nr:Septin-domain-containing protein [Powellomyces hirtus]
MTSDGVPPDAEHFVAFAAYAPVHADELGLAVGDIVVLMHSYDDGWILGKNMNSNAVGLAPCNFLQSSSSSPMNSQKPNGVSNGGVPVEPLPMSAAPNRTASLILRTRRTSHITPFEQMVDKLNKDLPTPSPLASGVANGTMPGGATPPHQQGHAHSSPAPLSKVPEVTALTAQSVEKTLRDIMAGKRSRAKAPEDVGRIRLCFVGDSGIGKTSLVRHFLQVPEIVATDPSVADLPALESTPFAIHEYNASTIPNVSAEEFNLTFIDTPGFGNVLDALDVMRPVVAHLHTQFNATNSLFTPAATPTQLSRFLASSTGAHTNCDVIVYCILHRLTAVDMEYIKRLDKYAAVVPVIVCSDTMSAAHVKDLKKQIVDAFVRFGLDIYSFGLSKDELAIAAEMGVGHPFAVSTFPLTNNSAEAANSTSITPSPDSSSTAPEAAAAADKSADATQTCTQRIDEFADLKRALLMTHIDDLRRVTADRFVKWRSAGARNDL